MLCGTLETASFEQAATALPALTPRSDFSLFFKPCAFVHFKTTQVAMTGHVDVEARDQYK
jgi:hypothetical protein